MNLPPRPLYPCERYDPDHQPYFVELDEIKNELDDIKDAYEDLLKLYDQIAIEVNMLKAKLNEVRARGFEVSKEAKVKCVFGIRDYPPGCDASKHAN
ncbi:hypothetical protein Ancab_034405 [Ancistrocladus abbreviatus]